MMRRPSTYFSEEMQYLREMGAEFAKTHPGIAENLFERGTDPDVERLLEGVAFLTSRIRERLDDDFPELVDGFFDLLWPQFVRPLPAASIVEFTHTDPTAGVARLVPAGTRIDSRPVQGVACGFETVFDTWVEPFTLDALDAVHPVDGAPCLRLRFCAHTPQDLIRWSPAHPLRVFCFGRGDDGGVTRYKLFRWLSRSVTRITLVRPARQDRPGMTSEIHHDIPPLAGFADDEGLWAGHAGDGTEWSSHEFAAGDSGIRWLTEYYALPERFLFFDLPAPVLITSGEFDRDFEIVIEFDGSDADRLEDLRLDTGSLRLGCCPVVNLFRHRAIPIVRSGERTEYLLRLRGDPVHYEIYSIESVIGHIGGVAEPIRYEPVTGVKAGNGPSYIARIRPSLRNEDWPSRFGPVGGTEAYLSLFGVGESVDDDGQETLEVIVRATNRLLPVDLAVGDIDQPAPGFAGDLIFRNIVPVTPPMPPPVHAVASDEQEPKWKLLSFVNLHWTTLAKRSVLLELLDLCNFPAQYDENARRVHVRQSQAIIDVRAAGADSTYRGMPIRGCHYIVSINPRNFDPPESWLLFAEVLNHVLAASVTINSFSQLSVRDMQANEMHHWERRLGSCRIV